MAYKNYRQKPHKNGRFGLRMMVQLNLRTYNKLIEIKTDKETFNDVIERLISGDIDHIEDYQFLEDDAALF